MDEDVAEVPCEDCGDLTREDVLEDVSDLNAWPVARTCPECAASALADDEDQTAGDRWPEQSEAIG